MKKILSFLMVMLISVTIIFTLVPPVIASAKTMSVDELKESVTNSYEQAKKLSGKSSFSGLCGTMVGYQLKALGVNTSLWAVNGKDHYDHYINMKETNTGYKVTCYPASRGSIEQTLKTITQNGTVDAYNILVGFQKGSTSSAGQTYGHVVFINGIKDGIVYFCESYSTTIGGKWYKEGSVISCNISTFANYYKNACTQFEGIVHFEWPCDCEKLNDYTDDGKCKSCGSAFDFESTKEDAKGIYGTTKKISVSTTPYSATQDTNNTLKAGTAVEVIAKYKNAFDNTWYKVSYGNGKTGYLYETSIKEVSPTVLPSSVLATATVKTEVMSLPCSAKTNSTSYEVAILKKGESFDVTQIVENIAGNFWYKVKTAAGDEGWVWCEETKVKTFNKETSSIIIGSDFPTSIPKAGKHVDYKVQTSYSNIRNVTGAIYNGSATSGTALYSKTMDVNSKYVNIYGSSIDNALPFGSLTAGRQYTLVITANLAYGYYDSDSGNFKAYMYSVSKHWTFTVQSNGASCSHSYSSTYSSNSDNHWKACTKCGATTSVAAHSYSNTCDTSCNTCGYTRSINHTYSNDCDTSCNVCGATRSVSHNYEYMHDRLEDKTSTKHWRECTICGNKVDEASHTLVPVTYSDGSHMAGADGHYMGCHICNFAAKYKHVYDNDCDTLCNICNHENSQREPNHSYSSSYLYDANSHWRYCVNCNEKTSTNTHNYSNSCDATCNTCNYTRTTSHSYSNACDTSCNVCGATRSASHTYSNACDTSCNVCGASRGAISHEYDNACDTSCNICGAIRTTAHKYSNACDKSCDVCGAERTVPGHVYDHDCDTSCNNCGYSRSTSHTYDNNCDEKCNVCNAVRSVSHPYTNYYFSDETKHWRQCNDCGKKEYIESHVPGNPPTETTSQICIVCYYVIQPATHTHSYSDEYKNDSDYHWYECDCGARKDSSGHVYNNDCDSNCNTCEYVRDTEHIYNEGVVNKEPTTTEEGEKIYTCIKCGEKKHEKIDALPKDENAGSNNPGIEKPTDEKNPVDNVLRIEIGPTVAIVAVVVVAAIVVVAVVVSLNKKPASTNPSAKTNSDTNSDENSEEDSSKETEE